MATLREIQLCQLDILKTVADICTRNNIPYYLAYGTFLGAVRHKGFIPWDDDVDIYMRYDDLKRFRKICKKELPEKYFYQDAETDITSKWIFSKVRANGTHMSETYDSQGIHADYHEGVWIDIFPLLDLADTPEKQTQQVSNIFEYQHMRYSQVAINKDMSIPGKLFTTLMNIKAKLKLNRYRNNFEKLQSADSGFVIVMANAYYPENTEENRKKALTEIIAKDMLVPCMYPFEDAVLCGMKDYDTYLTNEYGCDYMTPKKWSHIQDYSHVIV